MPLRETEPLCECIKHGHGYYRGRKCQYCDEPGELLFSARNLDSFTRILAGVLRHFPDRFELEMDLHGWVEVAELADTLKRHRHNLRFLTPRHVEAVVDTDEKGRYQLESGRVRATYAHSLELDLDLPTDDIPSQLFFAASQDDAKSILERGLFPGDRQMVHLSRTRINSLEAGHHIIGKPVVLIIDTEAAIAGGNPIMRAGTTVFVTKLVEVSHISRLPEA